MDPAQDLQVLAADVSKAREESQREVEPVMPEAAEVVGEERDVESVVVAQLPDLLVEEEAELEPADVEDQREVAAPRRDRPRTRISSTKSSTPS